MLDTQERPNILKYAPQLIARRYLPTPQRARQASHLVSTRHADIATEGCGTPIQQFLIQHLNAEAHQASITPSIQAALERTFAINQTSEVSKLSFRSHDRSLSRPPTIGSPRTRRWYETLVKWYERCQDFWLYDWLSRPCGLNPL